ncbi:MAG: Gfo/Idh/MocA family oxidoreductase [Planctomycetaceae bacterium]|nr:Gfo/Idh/MocA family oxidoreductase [Planctomycetaceae bacterium]
MESTRTNRRNFLRTSAAAAAAGVSLPYLVPSRVLGGTGKPGANENVRIGLIGCGGRAQQVAAEGNTVSGFRIAAVCDCFQPRAENFAKALGGNVKSYVDFRKMIEREKLDAVMIETTTHARAWIAVQAMQAGMDADIEKPMCLTIAEGRQMVRAARKYKRVTQVGTQQRSMPINNWASDLVKNGALGKVLRVIAPNFVGPEKWTPLPGQPMPKGGSDNWWDIWTNQAPMRPYHQLIHYGWDRWVDYDGGGRGFGVTGWGTHSYDQVNRALGTDATGPTEIWLEEPVAVRETGKFAPQLRSVGLIGEEDTGKQFHSMAKITGPRAKVSMRFASGAELQLHLDGDRGPGLGAIFVCENGKMEIGRNKIASNPRELIKSPENPGQNKRPETAYHIENWLDCIKSRKTCNADIEIGQRGSTLCYLVNIVRDLGRVGEKLHWDPVAERFTNCDEANGMLSRPRRKGYELPELA